ncbi:MAG TPA: peptide chain release factor N(5)-glutamine methyltransferase [Verrucomicrobiae bacterium]|nr:peptide chain release factor N(5)-glutamine methyltransferase [Verrucomicrobiae bacterium]
MTVLEAIQKSADFLGKKGVESARLNAELLLAHVLKLPRMKLYLNFERALTAPETDGLRDLVKRRGAREPLQHITGSTSFCGYEIAVSRSALVPRPETEMLAEMGWSFLAERKAQHAESESGAPTSLDFGTGTGCIAIALAMKCPGAQVTALDVSAEALALARQNAEANKARIEFLQGDGFAALPGKTSFDLIASNPPYIASAEIETLDPEVRDFDPRGALDGGADGLDFYRRLAREAVGHLKPGGKIMMEFGDGQAEAIKTLFEGEKWIVETVKEDYSHRARILVARRS